MKIGLMGGTFNPIHIGHLIIAEHIRTFAGLDKVVFIPTGHPPHKDEKELVSAEHRYNMVKIAIDDNPYFEASRIEIDRVGSTYTIDTVEELKKTYPEDEFFFLIGGDTLDELLKWKNHEKLLKTTQFILVGRSGVDEEKINKTIKKYKEEYDSSITYVKGPLIEISSTTIRDYLEREISIKYLVEKKVEKYIMEMELYKRKV